MARSSASSRVLTDHDEIREWSEQREAKPARVRDTGGGDDVGMIRLDFPGYSGEDMLEEISWDDWLRKFDESNLALVVQNRTANGELSNFNKLVSRDTVAAKQGSSRSLRSGAASSSGQQSRASSGNGGKRKKGRSEAGGEGCRRFFHSSFGAGNFGGVSGEEVIHGLLGREF